MYNYFFVFIEEPSDASGLGLEQCISAILYEPYQSSGDNVFSLSTTNCRLPHYPICYQEKSIEPVNVTAGETECNDTTTEGGIMGRGLEDDDGIAPFEYTHQRTAYYFFKIDL